MIIDLFSPTLFQKTKSLKDELLEIGQACSALLILDSLADIHLILPYKNANWA